MHNRAICNAWLRLWVSPLFILIAASLQAYCLDETKVQTASDGKTTLQSMYASIMFSGWGYGNRTCLANDPHLDPLNAAGNSMHDDDFGECIPGPNGEPEEGNAVVGV